MLKRIKIFLTFLLLGIGISLFFSHPAQAQLFIRGDVNCDEVVDTVDLRLWNTSIDNIICSDRQDVNDDGALTIADSVYLANYLFFGGPPPPHPFPTCGFDATADPLSCEFSCCCTLTTQCNDGIDNDGDGSVDFPADTGCTNACDSLETFLDQCKDGIDNDGDGLSDYPADCGCESESDTSEAPNAVTQCNDGIDNDGDGVIDWPNDCACISPCDSLERFPDQCKDGLDNDGDGFIDYPNDCGCSNSCDSTEAPNSVRQCNDGIDNDGDGLIDLADTNCVDSCDFNEFTLCLARPGNANGDAGQAVNLVDIIFVVGKVFKSGPASNPLCATNANGDGVLANLTDIVYLVNYVFKGGPAPIPSGVCCL